MEYLIKCRIKLDPGGAMTVRSIIERSVCVVESGIVRLKFVIFWPKGLFTWRGKDPMVP